MEGWNRKHGDPEVASDFSDLDVEDESIYRHLLANLKGDGTTLVAIEISVVVLAAQDVITFPSENGPSRPAEQGFASSVPEHDAIGRIGREDRFPTASDTIESLRSGIHRFHPSMAPGRATGRRRRYAVYPWVYASVRSDVRRCPAEAPNSSTRLSPHGRGRRPDGANSHPRGPSPAGFGACRVHMILSSPATNDRFARPRRGKPE